MWTENHKRDIVIGSFIILIGTIGFAFGYLIGIDKNHAPIVIQKALSN